MAILNVKTIRRLSNLAASKITEVANYNFRTLQEIEKFLDTIAKNANEQIKQLNDLEKTFVGAAAGTITVKLNGGKVSYKKGQVKTNKPVFKADVAKLQKSYDIVDSLHDKVEALDNIINTLTLSFKGEKGVPDILKKTKETRKNIQKNLDKAYTFLSKTAAENEPAKFKKAVDAALDDVLSEFSESFEKYTQQVYVVPYFVRGEQNILFSRYVEVKNFQNDEGIIYPKLYVVYNCVMDGDANLSFYVNVFRDFQPPARAPLGEPFTNREEARIATYVELAPFNFITHMERTAMPATQAELDKVNWSVKEDWIKSVTLRDDVLDFAFTNKITDKDKQEAINKLFIDVATFFRTRIKAKIVQRPYKVGKRHGVDFILTMPDNREQKRQIRADSAAIRYLESHFNLTEKQAAELIKQINLIEKN